MSVKFHRYRINPRVSIVLFCGVLLIVIYGLYLRIQPTLLNYASAALYQKAYYAANEVIRENLESERLLYEDLVHLERDTDGKVTAMQTDTRKLNSIKTKTLTVLLQMLRAEEEGIIRVPIGNFTGNLFLSGRGPKIPIKLLPVTSIEAEYQNKFSSAGINQTHHEIMMHITIHTGMLYPSRTIDKQIELDLCLAETIFVGAVPQFYAGIE